MTPGHHAIMLIDHAHTMMPLLFMPYRHHSSIPRVQRETLRVLHELGVDLNSADHFGCTPAHYVSRIGETETLRVLHELGANLHAADSYGATPAHDASGEGCTDTLWVLHDLGAN